MMGWKWALLLANGQFLIFAAICRLPPVGATDVILALLLGGLGGFCLGKFAKHYNSMI